MEQYREMPAFQGIDSDCMATLGELKEEIRKNFDMEDVSDNQYKSFTAGKDVKGVL